MALEADTIKTEHNGAKNGGGAWCRRAEAKYASRKRRRRNDRAAEAEGWGGGNKPEGR